MTAQVKQFAPVEPVDAIDLYDQTTLALEFSYQAEALASAIDAALRNGRADQARHLAGVMQYVATSQAAHFEGQARDLAQAHGITQGVSA